MAKKILSVFKTPILKCPRARRLLNELGKAHDCWYLCPPAVNEGTDERRYGVIEKAIQSPFTRWLSQKCVRHGWLSLAARLEMNRFRLPHVEDGEFDYIFVHDLYILPHFVHFTKSKIIFDAREYYPLEMAENQHWLNSKGKLAEHTCRTFMPMADKVLTVSPNLVEKYRELIGVNIHYFPSYPSEELLQVPASKTIDAGKIRFIHHGGVIRNRGIERMITLMEILGEGYELDLMLVSSPGNAYFDELCKAAAKVSNVNIIEPVHPNDIIKKCAEYDCGLYIMAINDSQNRFCLPNKFFEFVASGLPLITSFSEDMKSIIQEHNLGLAFSQEGLTEIADAIRKLSQADYDRFALAVRSASNKFTLQENIRNVFPELAA